MEGLARLIRDTAPGQHAVPFVSSLGTACLPLLQANSFAFKAKFENDQFVYIVFSTSSPATGRPDPAGVLISRGLLAMMSRVAGSDVRFST